MDEPPFTVEPMCGPLREAAGLGRDGTPGVLIGQATGGVFALKTVT